MNMYPRSLTSKYMLCRKGDGDDTVFEIREAYYDDGTLAMYATDPVVVRAKTVEELRVLLEEAANAVSGDVIRVRDHIEVEYELR